MWANHYDHAWFHLTYEISGENVICRSLDMEMDSSRFVVRWSMGRSSEDDEMYLEGQFKDRALHLEHSQHFDLTTGQCKDS